MQSLDVISVNLWQILVSLVNLLLLFLLIKKFLYKPVKKMLKNRQKTIDDTYLEAEKAKNQAISEQKEYAQKLSSAKEEADGIIQSAVSIAKAREKEILAEAKEKADDIIRQLEVFIDFGTILVPRQEHISHRDMGIARADQLCSVLESYGVYLTVTEQERLVSLVVLVDGRL